MLPSTLLTGSASANFCLSRLNNPPHRIVCTLRTRRCGDYATSLPGARYGLPGPVFHRLDRASFLAHKQSRVVCGALDCFAEPVIGRRYRADRWLAMTVCL